jgi:hypothetical protein
MKSLGAHFCIPTGRAASLWVRLYSPRRECQAVSVNLNPGFPGSPRESGSGSSLTGPYPGRTVHIQSGTGFAGSSSIERINAPAQAAQVLETTFENVLESRRNRSNGHWQRLSWDALVAEGTCALLRILEKPISVPS